MLGVDLFFLQFMITIKKYLPEERLDIKIKVIDEDTRLFIFTPHGKVYEEVCDAVL